MSKCNKTLEILRITEDSKAFQEMEEAIHRLEMVSGYNIDQLIEFFAAGYTLEAPVYLDMKDAFIMDDTSKNIYVDQRIEG